MSVALKRQADIVILLSTSCPGSTAVTNGRQVPVSKKLMAEMKKTELPQGHGVTPYRLTRPQQLPEQE